MDRISGCLKGVVNLGKGHELKVWELDDVIFGMPGLFDDEAEIYRQEGKDHLRIKVFSFSGVSKQVSNRIYDELSRVTTVRRAVEEDILALDPLEIGESNPMNRGMSKRMIRDLRL